MIFKFILKIQLHNFIRRVQMRAICRKFNNIFLVLEFIMSIVEDMMIKIID